MSCSARSLCTALLVVLASVGAAGAVSQIVDARAYPAANNHASPQMRARFPDLFGD